MVFKNGYHGGLINFGSKPNPLNAPFNFVLAPYNDIEGCMELVDDTIGAIIVEPMQSAGGMIPATEEFLRFLRQAADFVGSVLIFDEVVTSRLHYYGMQGHFNVRPDMTTLGKYIGGGFSFGVFGGRYDIMKSLDPRTGMSHSGTYNNNIFTMVAGIATSKVLTAEKIERTNQIGNKLREGIQNLVAAKKTTLIRITGYGSALGLHFGGSTPAALRDALFFYLLQRGIYIGKRGFMFLNIMHDESHVDAVLKGISDFIDDISL